MTACPSSAGGAQGGIRIMERERPVGWWVESTCCEIVTGTTWTLPVGAYLPPLTLEHLTDLEEALQRFRYPVVLGDFNVDPNKARNSRIQ